MDRYPVDEQMDEIELVLPCKGMEAAALEYKKEHFDNNEWEIHGSTLLDQTDSYDDWLEQIKKDSDIRTVNYNWVVTTTLFAVRKSDGRIVGMVAIRHTLNDFLRRYGGHIGFGVRPSERNKKYATQMLKLALVYCKGLGLERVMLACYRDNDASRKTITACGGILEEESIHDDGKVVQKYWITIN